MKQTVRGCLYRSTLFAGAAFVSSLVFGCSREPRAAQAPSRPVAAADKATCEARLVKSIWQGEDVGGPECSHFMTSAGQAPELSGSRVQTVCERTHMRAIMTGVAQTSFTERACAEYVSSYAVASQRKTCRRAERASPRDLTDVQEKLCSAYIQPREPKLWSSKPRREAEAVAANVPVSAANGPEPLGAPAVERLEEPTGRVWQGTGSTRWWSLAKAPGQVASTAADAVAEPAAAVAAPVAIAEAAPVAVAATAAVAASAPAAAAAPVAASAPAPVTATAPVSAAATGAVLATATAAAPATATASGAAPATATGAAAASGAAAAAAPASRVSCEDRYIESIWKGHDTSGPECATYVSYDGSTPSYNPGRIASVCLGAETRALRSDIPMTAFTLQACLDVLRARWSPGAVDPVRATVGADWNTDPGAPAVRRGLSDAAISGTVDASWRSIERDCFAVAPLLAPGEAPTKTPVVVTLTVGASGQVRSVAARAAGNRDLERCIESSVRSWLFPEAIGNTVISVPLVYDRGP